MFFFSKISIKGFCFGIEVVKNSEGLVYFASYLYGGEAPPITKVQNTQAPLRVFDNFNSKAKTLDALNFAKFKDSKLKASIVFALELKLSKTLRGLVYFASYLYGGESPP